MTELVLSAKGKARMLKMIKDTLGEEAWCKKQMKPFMAGKMKTEVMFTRAYWTVTDSCAVNKEKRIGQPFLTNSYIVGHDGNGYMHYSKPDANFFEVRTCRGYLYMMGEKMVIDTYPDIGKIANTGVEKVQLDKVKLDENNIHIILGPAIW